MEHGASWKTELGYKDNVMGTLSFASVAEPEENGDWLACAEALIELGMPLPPERYEFSDEVTEFFASVPSRRAVSS
jgi:hypothetical protein